MQWPSPTVLEFEVASDKLQATRNVSVFLPPGFKSWQRYATLYCTDGQALRHFAEDLNYAMATRVAPAVVVIGVHSMEAQRCEEYLVGLDEVAFEKHRQFFTSELISWAQSKWKLHTRREATGVFGFSNGGSFALKIGAQHWRQFGIVIAFSVAGGSGRFSEHDFVDLQQSRIYLSAGTQETDYRAATRTIGEHLERRQIVHRLTERFAGHDFDFWKQQLPDAVGWSYSQMNVSWLATFGRLF